MFGLSVLTGCDIQNTFAPTPTPVDLVATPFTQVDIQGDQVIIELGLNVVQPGEVDTLENPLLAHWELAVVQGEVLAEGEVDEVPSQSSGTIGNARYIARWRGVLQPGTYQVTWGAPKYGYTLDEFVVVVEKEQVKIEDFKSTLTPHHPKD
jgi:hypothetical protein